MSSHISYHPLGTDTISRYTSYMSSQDPGGLAAVHYDGAGAHPRFREAFVALASQAQTLAGAFDASHGLNLAVTQGFFGRFYYVHNARLSVLGDSITPYATTWQELLPSWPAADSANNELGERPSSGIFIAAEQVAQLMRDMHNDPALQAAITHEFPAEKLQILWAALNEAHQSGVGLLEASGVIEPDPTNIAQSLCRTNQTNCDPAGLRLLLASVAQDPGTTRKVPGAPSLSERMRNRAQESPPADL